jgi:DivIVA domain-containing protein
VRDIEASRQRQNASKSGGIRSRVPDVEIAAARDVRFSTAIRGYDRDEVDRYVSRVNNLIAELQITAAPESTIKAALEDVRSEQRSVVEEAHRSAEEITARSRARADDRVQEATQEAEKLREDAIQEAREIREAAERDAQGVREAAEERVRELEAQVDEMLERRERVIEELGELARSLDGIAGARGGDAAAPTAPQPAQTG